MSDADEEVCPCGHSLNAHLLSARTPRVRCPHCACDHWTSRVLQRALRLIEQGRLRDAQRVIDAARRRH